MHPSPPDTQTARPPYRPPIGIPLPGEPRARATVASVFLHALMILLVLAPTLVISRISAPNHSAPAGPDQQAVAVGEPAGAGCRRNQDAGALPISSSFDPPGKAAGARGEEAGGGEEAAARSEEAGARARSAVCSGRVSRIAGRCRDRGKRQRWDIREWSRTRRGRRIGRRHWAGVGNGPGTGGGTDLIYPPSVVSLPILPLPIPCKVRPYRMVAQFEVDTLGNARLLDFSPSRDAGYNRRIKEMLLEIRFRPGSTGWATHHRDRDRDG